MSMYSHVDGLFIGQCGCLPFTHHKFPADTTTRQQWTILVNRRKSDTDATEWTPDETSVICSVHFKDGKPTDANPLPTQKLGYESIVNTRLRNSRSRSTAAATAASQDILMTTQPQIQHKGVQDSPTDRQLELPPQPSYSDVMVKREVEREPYISDSLHPEHAYLREQHDKLQGQYMTACMKLKESMHQLKQLRRPLHQRILVKDSDFQFYTGLPSREVFNLVVHYIHACLPKNHSSSIQARSQPPTNYSSEEAYAA